MPLITVVVVLIILGFLLYLAERYIPMAEPFKLFIRIVVVVGLAIWILQVFGLWGGLGDVRIGR